ncbi:hypothetical protein EJD97_019455, partial [Solanum chilense]
FLSNRENLGDGAIHQPLSPIDAYNQVRVDNQFDNALRIQLLAPRLQDYYRGNVNIAHSDGPLVLPPLLPGHTFLVMSSLMQIFTAKGLISGVPLKDPMLIYLK